MWKTLALMALIAPVLIYTTNAEWQRLGFLNFSDAESTAYIEDFSQRIATIPDKAGDWVFTKEVPTVEQQIKAAGITKYHSRIYRNQQTGDELLIFLSTGPRSDICIHTPNECNPASGEVPVLNDNQVSDIYQLDAAGEKTKNLGSFVWQKFRKAVGNESFEKDIWWSYNETGRWQGEKNPRMAFSKPAVYKLYVQDARGRSVDGSKKQESPQLSFLRAFLPELNKTIFPVTPTESPKPEAVTNTTPVKPTTT